jgi:hemolysin III
MTAAEARDLVSGALSRQLTRWEIGVDGAIHAAAIVAAFVGTIVLIWIAAKRGGAEDVAATAVYSTGLLTMLGCSCAYNLARWTRHGNWLRSLDNSAVFVMIAGTYTPFTVLHLQGAWSISLTSVVWALAGGGILVRLLHGRLFDRCSIALYLALGWVGLVALAPLVQALDAATLSLLMVGGGLYTVGVVFHLWERLPFQTAIWHGFVVAAAATHYAAVVVSILAASALPA